MRNKRTPKYLLFIWFVTLMVSSHAQEIPYTLSPNQDRPVFLSKKFLALGYHENGQLKYEGKYIKCTGHDLRADIDIYEKRKVGKWIFYNQNGTIEHIERYDRNGKCDEVIQRSGAWEYRNGEGKLYRKEVYAHDVLVSTVIPIYRQGKLEQQIVVNGSRRDTLITNPEPPSDNLIPNPGFESYYYQPILITNSGQDQLQKLIPYWSSPKNESPDYYNGKRSISNIFNVIDPELLGQDSTNGFIGLMTYLDRAKAYSEHIQTTLNGTLKKGVTYCLHLKIIASQNSGFTLNRLGVMFGDSATFLNLNDDQQPQVRFTKELNDTQKWMSLCASYAASGGEQQLAIGRFAPLEETRITMRDPTYINKLDINEAAYYLIDDVELIPASGQDCGCIPEPAEPKIEPEVVTLADIEFHRLFELARDKPMVLKEVQFNLNDATILPAAIPELERLKKHLALYSNVSIQIAGHTDDTGNAASNLVLSKKRADAIRDWMVTQGIDQRRIETIGMGSLQPMVSNTSEENRALNRRVEFRIID